MQIEQKTPPKGNLGAVVAVSEEELKIRDELEEDVERNLEEEIKDQICHLSLQLNRLYQRRKERLGAKRDQGLRQEKSFLEVNISIKMEGGTNIEIKETRTPESRETRARPCHRPASESGASRPPAAPLSGKSNFDWARSLRSS